MECAGGCQTAVPREFHPSRSRRCGAGRFRPVGQVGPGRKPDLLDYAGCTAGKVLSEAYTVLKPGGKLLIDLHNRDHLLRNWLPYSIDRYDDGLMVLQERQFNLRTGRNEAAITLLHSSRERTEYVQSQRVYTLPELEHMFTEVNLQIKEYYGSLDKSRFTLNSNRLTIIGQK